MPLEPGTRVAAYEIVSALGAGGMGEVYRARDARLGRDVALKYLAARLAGDPVATERFVREARAASALNHPHIVTIHDIGDADGGHFIVMELVEGRTLRDVIAEHPPLAAVAAIGRQVARALAAAHAAGIVHRDIKPENVMVRPDGIVKVLDFGIARLAAAQEPRPDTETVAVTTEGIVVGTPRYMSPEQAAGDPVGPPTDIFAFGLVLYELAAGRHPFGADTNAAVLRGILSLAAGPPSRHDPNVPAALDELILAMLEKEPAGRPSADDVDRTLDELAHLAMHAPVLTTAASVERRIAALDERDRRVLVAASVQGDEFHAAIAADALGLLAPEVEERLERLEREDGVVQRVAEEELPDGTLTLQYRFPQARYRQALHATLTPARRAPLSASVARAIVHRFGEHNPAVAAPLAELFEAARDFRRAAGAFRLAAREAYRARSFDEAIALARRGLAAIAALPDDPDRDRDELALLLAIGPPLARSGNAEGERALARARELAGRLGETAALLRALHGLWEIAMAHADFAKARECGEQLLMLTVGVDDPAERILAHRALGEALLHTADLNGASEQFRQAVVVCDRRSAGPDAGPDGALDDGPICRGLAAVTSWHLGFPDQARTESEEAVALARASEQPATVAAALACAAWVRQLRGEVSAVRAYADECAGSAFLAIARLLGGWALCREGRHDAGVAAVHDGLSLAAGDGVRSVPPHAFAIAADAYEAVGRSTEAREMVEQGLRAVARSGGFWYEAELLRLKGELLSAALGPAVEAEECFRRALDASRRHRAKGLELRAAMSLGRLLGRTGRGSDPLQALREARSWFTEGFESADLAAAAAMLHGGADRPPSQRRRFWPF